MVFFHNWNCENISLYILEEIIFFLDWQNNLLGTLFFVAYLQKMIEISWNMISWLHLCLRKSWHILSMAISFASVRGLEHPIIWNPLEIGVRFLSIYDKTNIISEKSAFVLKLFGLLNWRKNTLIFSSPWRTENKHYVSIYFRQIYLQSFLSTQYKKIHKS